jgi:hypothetical protein
MRRWKAYLILTAAVAIQPNWSHAAEPSPFLGAWQVDVSKLPVPQPPKSVTLKVSDVGKETWRIDIDTVSQDGAVIHADARFRVPPWGSVNPPPLGGWEGRWRGRGNI